MLISTLENELYRVYLPQASNYEEVHYGQEFLMDRMFLSPIGRRVLCRRPRTFKDEGLEASPHLLLPSWLLEEYRARVETKPELQDN